MGHAREMVAVGVEVVLRGVLRWSCVHTSTYTGCCVAWHMVWWSAMKERVHRAHMHIYAMQRAVENAHAQSTTQQQTHQAPAAGLTGWSL